MEHLAAEVREFAHRLRPLLFDAVRDIIDRFEELPRRDLQPSQVYYTMISEMARTLVRPSSAVANAEPGR